MSNQTTGRCGRCDGGMYHDGLNWRHSANDRTLPDCPTPDLTPRQQRAWVALLSCAHQNLAQLEEDYDIREPRMLQAKEILRRLVAEAVVDGAMRELGIEP